MKNEFILLRSNCPPLFEKPIISAFNVHSQWRPSKMNTFSIVLKYSPLLLLLKKSIPWVKPIVGEKKLMKKYEFVLRSHTWKALENQYSLQINYAERSWGISRRPNNYSSHPSIYSVQNKVLQQKAVMMNVSEINSKQFSTNVSDEGLQLNLTERVVLIIQIIITTTACPFTILLNILVIMAVKKTPRLQSKANILLACLAATDAFIGLTAQPSYVFFATFQVLDMNSLAQAIRFHWHDRAIAAGGSNCLLHLMLVTFERLVAIKFTIHYLSLITEKNIKVSVVIFWIIAFCTWVLRYVTPYVELFTLALLVPGCIIFLSISYVILYRETLRHKKRIKTEQMAQQEVQNFLREDKALKTTVYVVGSLIFCFIPSSFLLLSLLVDSLSLKYSVYFVSFSRVFIMLNSLLNPLLYFWRDKEMRKLVLPFFLRCITVNPSN